MGPACVELFQFVNHVHVVGQDLLKETVTDDDEWSTDILRPVIEVTKSGEATAHVGDTVHYTIQVHNAGNTALVPAEVTAAYTPAHGDIAPPASRRL